MTFSIDDETTWRVTAENPVRGVDGLDWERCSALHNLIVRLGWASSGNPETEMPRTTWWQNYVPSPDFEDEWPQRLSPSVKLFLQAAFVTPPDQEFFFYAAGLSSPFPLDLGMFWRSWGDEDMIRLYQMTNLNMGGHRDGLR